MIRQIHNLFSDLKLFLNRVPPDSAVDFHGPVLRRKNSRYYTKQRRFAHAIGPNDGYQFARLNAQIDLAQDRSNAVMLGDIRELDHRISNPGMVAADADR